MLVLEDRTPIGCIEEIFGPGTGSPLSCPFPETHASCPLALHVSHACLLLQLTEGFAKRSQCISPGVDCTACILATACFSAQTSHLPFIPRSDEPVLRAALRGPAAHASQPGAGGFRIQREQVRCFGLGQEQRSSSSSLSFAAAAVGPQVACCGCAAQGVNQRASLSWC